MPSWLNLPQAEIAKTIWTFASQLSLFSLTIIAASYAWSRESNYKLKSEADRECLVSFYTLTDAVKEMGNSSLYIAPSDTDHSVPV